MIHRISFLVGILSALLATTMTYAKPASDYPNPLILQRADPWVIQEDGQYYFIATVPAFDLIELRSAETITGLPDAEPKVIWRHHKSGPMSLPIWAPELHRIDGKWYVYFAAGNPDLKGNNIRMYVLENGSDNPLEGEWMEKGRLQVPWDTFCLDATMFEHKGINYLVWAQHKPGFDGNTSLFIAKLKTPWAIEGEPVEISVPTLDWEVKGYKVNEGPAVLKRNGRIFITYSASATDENYCMGMLTAQEDADLLNPDSWVKSQEPVFKTSEKNGIYGPGHNSFTKGDHGEDLLVYHARSYPGFHPDPLGDPNRHTRVQPFGWNEDGTPDFGKPLPENRDSGPKPEGLKKK